MRCRSHPRAIHSCDTLSSFCCFWSSTRTDRTDAHFIDTARTPRLLEYFRRDHAIPPSVYPLCAFGPPVQLWHNHRSAYLLSSVRDRRTRDRCHRRRIVARKHSTPLYYLRWFFQANPAIVRHSGFIIDSSSVGATRARTFDEPSDVHRIEGTRGLTYSVLDRHIHVCV